MVALWCIIGLIVSTVFVSILGAAFSVFGLGQLFSGATLAVSLMAGSLELSKFMVVAYLHQTWWRHRIIFRSYLTVAVIVLSCITSMGIFGFLSNAYQSASTILDAENIKLSSLKSDQQRNLDEIARINHSVDEIPANRITKRLQARKDAEAAIENLNHEGERIAHAITDANLKILEVKKKIGPLVYISRALNAEIDVVVKYLILVFVFVFDPLAICLVIAVSDALKSRQVLKTASQPLTGAITMRFTDGQKVG